MLAIVGGLGAALVFATVTLCNSRSTRMIGPAQLLAWVMLIGLAITAPLAFARGIPDGLDAEAGAWMAVAGVGNVAGLLLAYSALRVGKGGDRRADGLDPGRDRGADRDHRRRAGGAGRRDAPGGDRDRASGWPPSRRPRSAGDAEPRQDKLSHRLLAIGAAVAIGWSLYAIGRVSVSLPVVWALLPSRVIGVLVVTLPLACGPACG